jgi:hypothetical protein
MSQYQEMLGSNHDRFLWFFSGTPGKWWNIALNYATADSYHILSNQLFDNQPMLQNMGH